MADNPKLPNKPQVTTDAVVAQDAYSMKHIQESFSTSHISQAIEKRTMSMAHVQQQVKAATSKPNAAPTSAPSDQAENKKE